MSQIEHTPSPEPISPESNLNQLVLELDAADYSLCMTYSDYLDKPRSEKLESIDASQTQVLETYGDILMMLQDTPEVVDQSQRANVLAGLYQRVAINHATLLAEYTPHVKPPDDEAKQIAFEGLVEEMIESDEGDVGNALDLLIGLFRIDMVVLEQYTIDYYNSPKSRFKERLTRTTIDIAKIGAGTFIAFYLHDRISRP